MRRRDLIEKRLDIGMAIFAFLAAVFLVSLSLCKFAADGDVSRLDASR